MLRRFFVFWAVLFAVPSVLIGQTVDFWVQVEAHPDEGTALQEARLYSRSISEVNAYAIGAGWYAISIGPFGEDEAQSRLFELRSTGAIPIDSFLSRGSNYQDKIWPLDVAAEPQPVSETITSSTLDTDIRTLSAEPDETLGEARQSEQALSRDEKKQLQIALKSAGYYSSAIDGDFGAGTRAAFTAWQNDEGVPLTGVLTTGQRAHLLWQYNRVLQSLGMEKVSDTTAGVAMNLPLSILAFSKYEPPLAHYASIDGGVHAAYVISQQGDRKSLRALYKALQTLSILPKTGDRSLTSDRLEITGENSDFITYAEATLRDNAVKGFILVWPVGDDERRSRLLADMQASFTRLDGVLNPDLGSNASQKVDLLFGLDIKKPAFVRSGIFVSNTGHIVTDASGLKNCARITVEHRYEASLMKTDPSERLAILKVSDKIAPKDFADLSVSKDGIGDSVLGAGFSFGGRLMVPSIIPGTIEELQSLTGDVDYVRLAMSSRESDTGGPVLNRAGSLSGVLVTATEDGRSLPENVSYAIKADKVIKLMNDAGRYVNYQTARTSLSDVALAKKARDMTALVSCWNN
jgi:S1-C subfamily serine protease